MKWTPAPTYDHPYRANGRDFLFVRDHLGSVVLSLEVKRRCVLWSEETQGQCDQWALVAEPAESYEYAPYGTPSIHAPADPNAEDVWSQPGRLAIKAVGVFSTAGTLHADNILDPADIGRPTTPATNYGRTWVRVGAIPAAHSSLGWAYLFNARAWDADARQYYYRYRWYDPHQGRWTALDPLGYAGGIEQYAYCAWNPVNFVDPLGLEGAYSFGGGGGGGAWGERLADRLDASLNGLESRALAGDEHWIWNGTVGTFADLGRETGDLLRFGRGFAEDQVGYSSTTGKKLTELERSEAFWGDVSRGFGIVLTFLSPAKPGGKPARPTRSLNPSLRRRGAAEVGNPGSAPRPTRNILATGGHSAQPKGGVYVLRDRLTGQPMRCGRTNDFKRRQGEHGRDPRTRDLDFEEQHWTDDYSTQRGLEQRVHDQFNPPMDRIEPISPRNKRRSGYLRAADEFLNGAQP